MKRIAHESLRNYYLFEQLIIDLFTRLGYEVSDKDKDLYDLKLTRNKKHIAEIKYYRTSRAQMPLLRMGILRIIEAATNAPEYRPLFITSCFISPEQRKALKNQEEIDILDARDIAHLASNFPEIQERFFALLEISPDSTPTGFSDDAVGFENTLTPPRFVHRRKPGKKLAVKLAKIPTGPEGWSDYEKHCSKILEYLFEDNLTGWHPQQSTTDNLNRYDLVCRVIPSTDFWSLISQALSSRYIIFEFKNYGEKIKQEQILTTEKYLLEQALRKTAIIFSRKGASESAIKMSQGAMRENGKLIITLSDSDVIEMLDRKDRGSDPSDYLFYLVDDFLLTLPR
ncbi:restriction endonuclease [Metapseudomonas otitidis]|uniref:restriction endonuclease n=1 Tax=Metapseudomonas otitidis TaxID=319939 RepID=UPI001AAE850D|nr:restriction endonuclease [Pseudomonas otitidis]MBO2927257.1 restriction endonuclease [Pseudomonas otitidis]